MKVSKITIVVLMIALLLCMTKASAHEVLILEIVINIPSELSLDDGLRYCEDLSGIYNYEDNTCTIRVLTDLK